MLLGLKNKNNYIDNNELKMIQILNPRQIRKQIMTYPLNGHSITMKINNMRTLLTKTT